MKTFIISCTALLSAAGCTFFSPTTETEIFASIVIDQIDTLTVYPDAKAICTDLGLTANPYKGVSISITTISDMSVTPEKIVTLESEKEWQGNIHVRQSQITAFTDTLAKTIATFIPADSAQTRRSVLFHILSKQLNVLSQKQGRKVLYLYSDLSENSDFLNTYQPSTLKDMKRHPHEYATLLDKDYQLPDLTGVTVYCMYNPQSQATNYRYSILSSMVTLWLENHHAVMILKASH